MRTCSFGLTSAVGTAISLAGTSRVPASSAKAPVGMAKPSARTARCNLKIVLIGRLPELLVQPWDKLFWHMKLPRQCFRCMPLISPATAASGLGNLGNESSIHDVGVNPIRAGRIDGSHRLGQAAEIGGENGRKCKSTHAILMATPGHSNFAAVTGPLRFRN